MSKNDYKKGVSDAVEAYEGFGKKQEAAIEHVAGEVAKAAGKMDKLGDKIGEIKDYITDKEKAALYKLNTPVDIAALENNEKRILLAVLYQLSADEEKLTEEQQGYVRAVQQYLKIYNPQTEIDLEAVENIEDITTQKAVLQTVLELFCLGTHPGTYSEEQLEFLDCFQVNRKTRREISDHIKAIVEAVGVQGLAEKYGFVAEQAKTDFIAYSDNGDIPEPVAEAFVSLYEKGGTTSFDGGLEYLDTTHYIVFCRDTNCDDEEAEASYQLFRMDKRTGEIISLPIDYKKDLPFSFPSQLQYHVQGDMLYLILDHLADETVESIHPIAVDVDKLTCRALPLGFKGTGPFNRFPRFHLSGDSAHLVVYSFEIYYDAHPKNPLSKIHIIDLMQDRAFLVEPDMPVRDAFWWDNSLMLLGKQRENISLFRYDISSKIATNIFDGEYVSAFAALGSFSSGRWFGQHDTAYIVKNMERTDETYYFLIKEILPSPQNSKFRIYTPVITELDEGDNVAYLSEILGSIQSIWTPEFYFCDGQIFQYNPDTNTFLQYDYMTKECTQMDKGGSYLMLGDWIFKHDDNGWYKTNISKGINPLQWEVLTLPEE